MDTRELTAEQEDEALRIADIVAAGTRADALKMGRLLASRKNSALFGATEFEVRDAVQRIGTRALETALVERNKGGLRVWLRLSRLPGGYRIPGLPVETVMSLLGSIESPRAYDHCRHGRFPTDEELGLTERSTPASLQWGHAQRCSALGLLWLSVLAVTRV